MKARILEILRNQTESVSGEILSGHLGVSRVAVWKHIGKLRELGYDIRTGPSGYRLENDPDAIFPWEFPGRENRVHYVKETASTMETARELARQGCPDFTLVLAERQTRGRGRLQRSWQSERGGLYFTLVLRPEIPPLWVFRLNFAASLALAEVLSGGFGLDAGLKWPNDVLVDEGKISGMLSEMEADADRVLHVNIGMGINVNNDPSAGVPGAVSISKLLGRPVARKQVLIDFLDRFEARIAAGLDTVIEEWKQHTVTLGRNVRIVTVNETSEGLAVDVDDNGALVLRLADGEEKRVIYGDCFHAETEP